METNNMRSALGSRRTAPLKRLSAAAVLVAAGFATPAMASGDKVDPQFVYNSSLAATCASCHGTNGVSVADARVPWINTLTPKEIAKAMLEYKNGTRSGTIMPQLAKGYTEAQIEIIAQVLGKK
jgi:cytochrome subunit of sulfide dehydrogenase